jgi:hypothetical protein
LAVDAGWRTGFDKADDGFVIGIHHARVIARAGGVHGAARRTGAFTLKTKDVVHGKRSKRFGMNLDGDATLKHQDGATVTQVSGAN